MAIPPHYNQWAPPLPQADAAHDEVLVNNFLLICFALFWFDGMFTGVGESC